MYYPSLITSHWQKKIWLCTTNFKMASRENNIHHYSSTKMTFLIASTILILASAQFNSAHGESSWAITCYNDSLASWNRWLQYVDQFFDGTKCDVQCSLNCVCNLGDYNNVLINCTNETMIVAPVPYPTMDEKFVSWADNRLSSFTENSFTSFAETLRVLNLNNNSFINLNPGIFAQLPKLVTLILTHNKLQIVEAGVFRGLAKLVNLDLSNNIVKEMKPGAFESLEELQTLDLSHNMIKSSNANMFKGLTRLSWLDLGYNILSEINFEAFEGVSNLKHLFLKNNFLSQIPPTTFNKYTRLIWLDLSSNKLKDVHPYTFQNLQQLQTLNLYHNELQFLAKGTFQNLQQLRYLELSRNNITTLNFHPFKGCLLLETLELMQNPLQWISYDSFEGLNDTTQIIVDNAATCCFVTKAKCNSTSSRSPFLTCGRLLPFDVLRVGIWIISILALINNVLGILVRGRKATQLNRVQLLLITNLSISDFLMGVYLITLLSVDLYYHDYFPSHSESWRNSMLCKVSGAISVLSSETSVFFITLISIDRFLRVKFPLSKYLLSNKSTRIVLPLLWSVAFSISISSFVLSWMDSDVYSVSETCVGLPISRQPLYTINTTTIPVSKPFRPKYRYEGVTIQQLVYTGSEPSMQFSFAIFAILNSMCFLVVGFCYITIFISVRQSAKRSGLAISRKEIHMAKKLSLLVLTDFCCWVPIGVLSILVQAGAVEVNPVAHAWIATFILPINSSINPFLYTLGDVIADKCTFTKCKGQINGRTSIQMDMITKAKSTTYRPNMAK